MIVILLISCLDKSQHLDEGGELDPNVVPDSGEDDTEVDTGDTGEPEEEDTASNPPEETDIEVCYPGPLFDYEVCFKTVDWSPTWGADYEYPELYQGNPQYSKPVRFLDLNQIDENTELAPNFISAEFMASYKGQYGIFMPHVVEKLQNMRDEIGGPLSINSGYRNITYNADVDGVAHSRHIYGDGVDMVSSAASLPELVSLCEEQGAAFTSEYVSHVHCDWRDSQLEEAFYDSAVSKATQRNHALPDIRAEIQHTANGWTAPATGFDEGIPQRRWTAYDDSGLILKTGLGELFTTPDGTSRVAVLVGGQIYLEAAP